MDESLRRRRVIAVGVGIVALLALVWLTWQQGRRIESLETQIAARQETEQAWSAQAMALRSTVVALEIRLAALETAQAAAADAAAEQAHRTAGLDAAVRELRERMDALQTGQPATAAVAEERVTLPAEWRLAVTPQRQGHNLSCESSAASMAARYHGVDLSEAEVLAALPRNDNPHLGFRGNVDGPTGGLEDYGVYAGPVMEVLRRYGLQVRRVEGGLKGIKAAIARGNPVIAWVTYNCIVSTPVEREIAGQKVTLVPYQHAVVITGYNEQGVWANDPWDGEEDFYTNADFERAWGYFGNMAIEVAAP